MNEVIIKSDDYFAVIRKNAVECVWRDKVITGRYLYYVRTNSGTKYELSKYNYERIRFMMENEK